MVWFFDLIFFALSCLILVTAGTILVRTLPFLARIFRLSEFVISFIIMAFSTSLPELFVGITSALEGNPALALGTVIGSNIANLSLVAGITIILARGFKSSSESRKGSWFMLVFAILPMVLMFLGKGLSRIDGVILLVVFVFYMFVLLSKKTKTEEKEKVGFFKFTLNIILFTISLFLLFYSAKYAVKYASQLAFEFMLPPILIGLFFIALGTSLPELVFGSIAARKRKPDLALGTLIGSVIANSTLILGITAIIHPITANFLLYITSAVFMIALVFLFIVFLDTDRKLSWKEGMVLILFYVLFLIIELNIPNFINI